MATRARRGDGYPRHPSAVTEPVGSQREFLGETLRRGSSARTMFIEKLPATTRTTLVRVAALPLPVQTYLAGGTAATLRLGHRLSDDLDLFTPEPFEPEVLAQLIQQAGTFELERTSWGTILGWLNGVRFSLFHYRYPLLAAPQRLDRLRIASVRDLAAMKIAALSDRVARKDFIDLYMICKKRFSLRHALKLYDRKYGKLKANQIHIYKSLVYFDQAESEPMPVMLIPFRWKQLKTFFEREVDRLMKSV